MKMKIKYYLIISNITQIDFLKFHISHTYLMLIKYTKNFKNLFSTELLI